MIQTNNTNNNNNMQHNTQQKRTEARFLMPAVTKLTKVF